MLTVGKVLMRMDHGLPNTAMAVQTARVIQWRTLHCESSKITAILCLNLCQEYVLIPKSQPVQRKNGTYDIPAVHYSTAMLR